MSEAVTDRAAGPGGRYFSRQRLAEYVIVAAIVVEAVVFASIAPQFLSVPNLVNVALSIAITGILAVGMTMVILTGGIDLSVGSVVALAGVVAAMLAAAGARAASRSASPPRWQSGLASGFSTASSSRTSASRPS